MAQRTVVEQLYTLAVPVPAATAAAAPLVIPWSLGNTTLIRLDCAFTKGAAFLAGIHFKYAGTIIVPWSATTAAATNSWVIAADETVPIPVDFNVSGGLSIEAYNLDPVNFHTIFLRAYVIDNTALAEPIAPAQSAALVITPTAADATFQTATDDGVNADLLGQLVPDEVSAL